MAQLALLFTAPQLKIKKKKKKVPSVTAICENTFLYFSFGTFASQLHPEKNHFSILPIS